MEEFIRALTEQIRYVKAREHVAREISDHITDQAQAYEKAGIPMKEALEKAVREMGDPIETGAALDRIHRPQTDWQMLLMILVFSAAGFAIMNTVGGLPERYAVLRQFLFMLTGFGVTLGIYFLDYSFIGKHAATAYIIITVGILLFRLASPQINGRVPGLSMLIYLYTPVYAGILYQFRQKGYAAVSKGTAALFATSAIAAAVSGSLPAALNLYFACAVMLITAVCGKWFHVSRKATLAMIITFLFLLPAFMAVLAACSGSGYRSMRIRAFFNPVLYKKESGYIYYVIRESLANVKLATGSTADYNGLLAGIGSFTPLLLIQSRGLLTGCVLMLAYILFIIRAFLITCRQKNQLGLMVSAACSLIFLINCAESLFLNAGFYPVTNIQLPFLSYGGCTTLTYAALAGLLLSVHRYEKITMDTADEKHLRWHLSVRLERRMDESKTP